jgi:hypothetical protein
MANDNVNAQCSMLNAQCQLTLQFVVEHLSMEVGHSALGIEH